MMPEHQPRRYQIPTHLDTPDKIDLPLFGMTVSLTVRQGVCFLLGGSTVFQLWQGSFAMTGFLGLLAHWVGPFLLAFATYVIGVHEIWGRHLEEWAIVWGYYLTRPKVFVWQSVLEESSVLSITEETEEAHARMTMTLNEEEEG